MTIKLFGYIIIIRTIAQDREFYRSMRTGYMEQFNYELQHRDAKKVKRVIHPL